MNAILTACVDAPLATSHDAFLADPYPTYAAWREAGPLLRSDAFFDGAWLVTRHADVERLLRDDRHFSAQRTGGWVMRDDAARAELGRFQRLFARAMLFTDAPDHRRLRQVLMPAFQPATLAATTGFIDDAIEGLLDDIDPARPFDFMAAVARPLPARVISHLMGLEGIDPARFMAWSDDIGVFIGAMQPNRDEARAAQASLLEMTRYFESLNAQRRVAPGDDLVSRLLQAQSRGEIADATELLAQCAMLLFAGYETTRHLLGNGVHALLSHPAQWQRLCASPELAPAAVRELLRFDSPVQYTGRRAAADVVLHDRRVRRGDLVLAMIGAANRDARAHDAPDALDIGRAQRTPLSFGSGPHVCIGAALTALEAQAVLRALVRRWPTLAFADAPPQRIANAVYRGFSALPVQVDSGRGRASTPHRAAPM